MDEIERKKLEGREREKERESGRERIYESRFVG